MTLMRIKLFQEQFLKLNTSIDIADISSFKYCRRQIHDIRYLRYCDDNIIGIALTKRLSYPARQITLTFTINNPWWGGSEFKVCCLVATAKNNVGSYSFLSKKLWYTEEHRSMQNYSRQNLIQNLYSNFDFLISGIAARAR